MSKYDKNDRQRMQRSKRRMRELNLLIPNRTCPNCEQVKTMSRSWILLRHVSKFEQVELTEQARELGIVCRECFYKHCVKRIGALNQ